MRIFLFGVALLAATLLRGDYLMWSVELPEFASTSGNTYYAVLAAVGKIDGADFWCAMKNPVALDSNGAAVCQRTYLKEAMYAYSWGTDPVSAADDIWGYNGNTNWDGFTFQVWILDANNNRVFSTGEYAAGRREWNALRDVGNAGKRVRNLVRWEIKPAPSRGLLFYIG